jgi:MFS family permease
MPNQDGDSYLVSRGYAWYVFFLLFVLMLFDFIDRAVLSSIYPFLKTEWGVTDAQCGVLSAAVSWSITVFSIPSAILADRWSRKKTVGLMSTIWSLATISCAFTRNFTQLFVARLVLGTGEAGYVPAGNAMISALFPSRLRASLMGIFIGAGTLGAAIGVVLGGWIATHYGWRHVFGVVGLPGLVFALLFFFVRDYKTIDLTVSSRGADGSTVQRKMNKKDIWQNIFTKPSLALMCVGQIFGFFFISALGAWLPSFFIRIHHLSVPEASAKAGAVLVLCIVGNYLGGLAADKLVTKGRTNGRPLVAAFAQLCNSLVFLAAFGLAQGRVQFLLLLLGGMMAASYNGPVLSSVTELVHPGLRSTAVSVMALLQNVFGYALGPVVAGLLSDRYGLGPALLVVSVTPALAMIMYGAAALAYNRDLAKVEKVRIQLED